ncbi:bifunctional riboflavin kinase/FAD synthetase [Hyunsoonleella sp. SJ7]|uniref:Riboflavin biosynthesis protein n=1 Tax=Hyunsoonleella aquatilis TaxID=2762758 RepID=A0A923KFW0_9FLAO|nr:bifunctional riboflavin kinase/FAD synthetase [Hyunsoonleella aquatilis]MBC3756936.1 bifunctional riboflavin kinase/FAD synthetase [Hyunsoonleella aquatilis]
MGKVVKVETYRSEEPTIVTIGTFDGVHIGHQKIVRRLIMDGEKEGLKSVILTFFPHPRMVLQKDSGIKLINTIDERSKILKDLGLNYLLIKKFTKEFSRLSAEEFVQQVLVDKLNAKKVIIGYDHRFGRNRNADIEDLKKYGEMFGFEVEEISAQDINDVAVSSTKIRRALLEGDLRKANKYLGYAFMLTGTIIKGRGIGKTLDFPTANLRITEDYKLIPKHGSYVVKSEIDGITVYGMMNIGMNPTVNGEKESVEIHFFDFDASIYGRELQIDLLERIRDEQKFDSIEVLKEQLQKDRAFSLQYIAKYHAE